MKSLKYIVASLVITLGVAAPIAANAQDAAPKAKQGQDRGAQLLNGITLTADQQTKIDAIKSDTHKKIEALPKDERREKAPAILKDSNDKIRAVLTPDQRATYDANLKKMQQHNHGKGKGKGDKSAPAPSAE